MLERIDQVQQEAQAELANVRTPEELEKVRIKYLGGSGQIKKLMAVIRELPPEQKPVFGQRANALRAWIQEQIEKLRQQLGESAAGRLRSGMVDVTEPGPLPRLGRVHVITQTIHEMIDIFGRMGFEVATGPEIEDEWHNFTALNIPPEHPARDPLDNFYLERTADHGEGTCSYMLRSQTSTIQIRVMEKRRPPIRVVAVGRVYRPDEHDATHYSMFHQIEGLYVDRRVSMADLKTTLFQFAHAFFGPGAEVRLRPSHFPFTEPSAEFDVKMLLGGTWQWKEIGGCGMVHPAVLEACGIDSEKWTGFAFGLGIERLAMRKYTIPDIRWLFENDLRFLRQF